MKSKTIMISSLPAIFFFIGIFFLVLSPLNLSKVIDMQNGVFVLFFQELNRSDMMNAILLTLGYLWVNVIWIILVFLILIGSGFIFYIFYLTKLDFRVVNVSQIIFVIIVFILTNFSVIMLLTSFSLLVGIFWMYKTFEPGKNNFSTGYSVITSRLGLMGILLTVGVFLTIFLNIQAYEEQISESNTELMMSFVPEIGDVKKAQKKEIEDIAEGFKYSLTERYKILSEDAKAQCKSMYDGLIQGLDNYKNRTFQKIDEQEIQMNQEELLQFFPFFDVFTKMSPLLIAVSVYALLVVLIPLVGIFSGIVYSVMKGVKTKKSL